MRGGAPAAHDSLVAKSKMMLILSVNTLNCKPESRLRHQYQEWSRVIKLVLFQQVFWWVSSSRDLCSPEYVLDFRQNTVGIYILPDGCCFGIE